MVIVKNRSMSALEFETVQDTANVHSIIKVGISNLIKLPANSVRISAGPTSDTKLEKSYFHSSLCTAKFLYFHTL